MERDSDNRPETPSGPRIPPQRTHHHLHRDGGYLGIDGDVDVAYGDGTPESLADLLWWPLRDPWGADRNAWDPTQPSWPDDEETR